MYPELRIRPFTEADAETFYALRLRALTEEPEAFGRAAAEYAGTPLAAVAARLRTTDDAFTLGAWTPACVGIAGFARETGVKTRHRGMIWGVYVAPAARGQGIARALMQEVIARAAALPGLEQIHLAVTATNVAAGALYRSLGFVRYGTEPRALKLGDRYLDEDLLALRLTSPPARMHGHAGAR